MPTTEALESQIAGMECALCESVPRIVWLGSLTGESDMGLRCNCWSDPANRREPTLVRPADRVRKRLGKMVNESLAVRPDRLPVDTSQIRQYISPKATEAEAFVFMRFCQALGLNAFTRDAYLIKYDERDPASIVIGISTYLKWASRNDQYAGYASGVMTTDAGNNVHSQIGSIVPPGHSLFGGWATIERHNWKKPLEVQVALSEYIQTRRDGQPTKFWAKMPATMIEKVAISQALRRAFPEDTAPLFDHDLAVTVADDADVPAFAESDPADDHAALYGPQEPQNGAGEPRNAQEPTIAPEDAESRRPRHPGEFAEWVRAQDGWGDKTDAEIAAAAGKSDIGEITDFDGTKRQLIQLWR